MVDPSRSHNKSATRAMPSHPRTTTACRPGEDAVDRRRAARVGPGRILDDVPLQQVDFGAIPLARSNQDLEQLLLEGAGGARR